MTRVEYFEYGQAETAHLKKRDKRLGALIDRVGPIKRPVNRDVFAALIESIVSQQISGKAAETVTGRLLARVGRLTPESLVSCPQEDVRQCGMSARKAGYIMGAAQAAVDKTVDFLALQNMSDDDVIKTLSSLRGVGVWTAEMLLIFSLCRPDVVSFGDLAIRRGMMSLYALEALPKEEFMKRRERYAPYGTVASLYLWHMSI